VAKSKRRTKTPNEMTHEELDRLIDESMRKIALLERFDESEEWRYIAKYLDGRLKMLENQGKGLRRRLMKPIAGQPAITLEQIASHEARLDETAVMRRITTTILGLWRSQLPELIAIRDERPR
jgi:hypothetical protein